MKTWKTDKQGRKLHIIDSGSVALKPAKQQLQKCDNCGGDHPYEDCDQDNWTYSEKDFDNGDQS